MSRKGSLWLTALLSAPFVFGAGCSPKVELGAMNTCGEHGVICDLDGGFSDAGLPIGDAQYPDFSDGGFADIAEGLEGDWHGVAAGAETILPPFKMHYSQLESPGKGTFVVHCLESKVLCVPIGKFDDSIASGEYRIAYVDGARVGRGEFTWTDKNQKSVSFSSLMLQGSNPNQVLSFVAEIPWLGSFQFVMQQGPWPDSGVPESDASTSDPAAPRSSVDAGNVAP